jgi:hypothetical protein
MAGAENPSFSIDRERQDIAAVLDAAVRDQAELG